MYDADGKAFAATVPPGVGPGGVFHMRVPVLLSAQRSSSAAEVTAASAAASPPPTGAATTGAAAGAGAAVGFSTSLEGVDVTDVDIEGTSEDAVTEAFTEMDRDCDGELTRFEVIKGCSASAKVRAPQGYHIPTPRPKPAQTWPEPEPEPAS